jgi:archaellum component FlaC
MDTLSITKWGIEELTGYKPITTFWEDFSIAEIFGIYGIIETYHAALNEWKNNYKYLTELVMVLNHKIWYWYDKESGGSSQLQEIYNELWEEASLYAENNLKDEQLKYYYRITD